MLDRIETSYESQKQFVSNASHELRTPICNIRIYADPQALGSENKDITNELKNTSLCSMIYKDMIKP